MPEQPSADHEHEDHEHEDHESRWQWGAEARPMAPVQLPGDERERAVLLEAALRGNRAMLSAMLLLAFVTALLGSWLIPAAILLTMALAGRVTTDYAGERGVDLDRLGGQRSTRSTRCLLGTTGMVLTFAVMSYTAATGHALLVVPDTGSETSALVRAAATGLPAGGAVAVTVFGVIDAVRRRRARGRS